MNTLRLYGELGKRFGRVHRYATNSVSSTLRLLIANYPELRGILNNPRSEVQYKVSVDTEVISLEAFGDPVNNKTIRIVPVIIGAGSDEMKVVGGMILFAGAMWLSGGTAAVALEGAVGTSATSVLTSTVFTGIMSQVGLALIYGGISSMLYSPPANNVNPSKGFDGAINTTRQGVCVPIGYGMALVGSATISAGISNT